MQRIYMCIDLKSFYASVECIERGLDPMNTNLVVADRSRTEKTICLAVTPSLKKYGLSGRSRLFEVISKVKEVNNLRKKENNYKQFVGKSYSDIELMRNKDLELDYIAAPPRMALYMKYSTEIYNVYLKYLSEDDIFVYSIDEVFCDITNYLKYYKLTPDELVTKIIMDVYKTTGITATSGIGTNLYLAKVAMDIVAKHTEPNEYGVRIAYLDEKKYRELLWNHTPLTDFWRVGKGTQDRLNFNNMFTMGDVCKCSLENEDLLYELFGVNAELLIDHAWGYEPTTVDLVKSYRPSTNSLSIGQVLHTPYTYLKTRIIVKEMVDQLSLSLVEKKLVTDQLVLTIGYDIENLTNINISKNYNGPITKDHYGRSVPKHAHGTIHTHHLTSSSKILTKYMLELFDRITDPSLLVRRVNVVAVNVMDEKYADKEIIVEQFDLFSSNIDKDKIIKNNLKKENEERVLQRTLLNIKNKYGKNAILKGMNFVEGATAIERNGEIGGHKG